MKYSLNTDNKKSARAIGRGMRISTKSSVTVCRAVSGMRLERGKKLLQDLLDQKRSLSGKYYTNTTKGILDLIKSAEANAESKGIDPESLHIHAAANQGYTFYRPRRFKRRRERAKVTNLQVILEAK
jgi:large subunit ribosomal protein L22